MEQGPTGDVIADLLPLIVGATAVPFYPIVVLVLLQGQGGLVKALAFVAGNIAVRVAQGVLFGLSLASPLQRIPKTARDSWFPHCS